MGSSNYRLILQRSVFAIFLAMPISMLILRKSGNVGFYMMLIIGLVTLFPRFRPSDIKFSEIMKKYWPLHLAMSSLALAILVNQIAYQEWLISRYDYPSRMALFFIILWVALLIPYKQMRYFQWAYVAGAITSSIKMYMITEGGVIRPYAGFMPIIEFAQLSQLLGFFSIISLLYKNKNRWLQRLEVGLKLLAGGAGVYASYLSQTRGAWIGIPVFIIISMLILSKNIWTKHNFYISVMLVTLIAGMFFSSELFQKRISQAEQDVTQFLDGGNKDTPVGIRLQLWKGSWEMFSKDPLFGVGRENFLNGLVDLEKENVVSDKASVFLHSHNEVAFGMATLGIFGLASILALYFVPAFYFLKSMFDKDKEVRAASGMGLILCAGFLMLGLVDTMFVLVVCCNFYTIFMAIFIAKIIKRKALIEIG